MSFYGLVLVSFILSTTVYTGAIFSCIQLTGAIQLAYVKSSEIIILEAYQNYLGNVSTNLPSAYLNSTSGITGVAVTEINGTYVIHSAYGAAYAFVN